MSEQRIKVLVSRPAAVPAPAPLELRRKDFCHTIDGEIVTLPDFPCADSDVCGCGWSFAGVSSALATSWAVVELRGVRAIAREIRDGKHLAGWASVDGFYEHILGNVHDVTERIRLVPLGAILGIWALDEVRCSLFDRSPARARSSTRLQL